MKHDDATPGSMWSVPHLQVEHPGKRRAPPRTAPLDLAARPGKDRVRLGQDQIVLGELDLGGLASRPEQLQGHAGLRPGAAEVARVNGHAVGDLASADRRQRAQRRPGEPAAQHPQGETRREGEGY